jgi:hypothetical protein
MPVECPCCRAANAAGPACRRCKADLGDLFAVESRRAVAVAACRAALAANDPDLALTHIDEAEAHRRGPDLFPLRAAAHLLNRHYTAAWKWYRAGMGTDARRPA